MKLIQHNQVIESQEFRSITHEGRPHWVIPIVMMVEGVHHGSDGPLLYTASELGRQITSWNGTPVVIGHPMNEDGNPKSANLPDITESIVGRLYNTHMDGLKLKSEAWIDIDHLQSVSEEAYNYLIEHRALEVSVGILAEEIDKQGEFNNEEYRAVAQNLQPDHLALLPGGVGACSWDDGCGVRLNQQNEDVNEEMKNLKLLSGKELLKEGIGTHIISLETGFREIMSNIQQKLDGLDSDMRVHFLEDLFDDNFIYRVHNRESNETNFYRRSYSVQEDGSIEFGTEPIQVRKDVSFIEMESGKLKRNKFSTNKKVNMENNASPCKVDALIANEATNFTEKDKDWLIALEDEQLEKLTPKEIKPPAVKANEDTKKKEAEKTEASTEDGPVKIDSEVLKEGVKAVFNEMKNPEEFIALMPKGMRGNMESGLKMYHAKRATLIEGIVKNSKFEAEALKDWNDTDLQSLYDSVEPEGDYSANGEGKVKIHGDGKPSKEMTSMLNLKEEEAK